MNEGKPGAGVGVVLAGIGFLPFGDIAKVLRKGDDLVDAGTDAARLADDVPAGPTISGGGPGGGGGGGASARGESAARGASYFTGAKSVGAAAAGARTGVKGLLKDVGLPHAGKIRFVPRPDAATQGLLKGPGGRGFVDKFGNVWVRPRGNIVGQAHWDVQLSATGKQHLGWASRSGSHINVSRDGRIVH